MKKHILSVFAQNRPGVLSRIAGLLRRKNFQIDSLTVGRTQDPKVSRFTIVIEGGSEGGRKTAKMIENLIEVLRVKIQPASCLTREIVLARFLVPTPQDEELLHKIEDNILTKELEKTGNKITLELIDTSDRLEHFLEQIEESNIEILKWVRSGVIAME